MKALFDPVIRGFVRRGTLVLTWPDGSVSSYGTGAPRVDAAITRPAAIRRMLLDPALALGELYMDGGIVPVGCTIHDVLDMLGANLPEAGGRVPGLFMARLSGRLRRRLDQFNPTRRARRNVAHHYDLDDRLYRLFLDEDRQYSCAYFSTGEETLEAAQLAKKRHIAAKLRLDRPGLRVLDIGCGWGGLALHLAREHGCVVDGITLSGEQLAASRARAEAAGLAGQVRFALQDYRTLDQCYDRIVSVGMFEHVGVNHYPGFFATVRQNLEQDGVALLHSIGRTDGPLSTNAWMRKYIFPGGYSPALSEILPPLEASGLIATDIEVLRLHYALTLRAWRARFQARRDQIAALYDERFCRMFEFYLAVSEMAFVRLSHVNFQIQLTRRIGTLPLTRDYMAAAEQEAGSLAPPATILPCLRIAP